MVPTRDLIQECESSLPPGLTYKWDQESLDNFSGPGSIGLDNYMSSDFMLSGLGLPTRESSKYDECSSCFRSCYENREVLLWKSHKVNGRGQRVIWQPDQEFQAFQGAQIYASFVNEWTAGQSPNGLCKSFSKSEYEEQGANRFSPAPWCPAFDIENSSDPEPFEQFGSLAEFGDRFLVHGQAASDWVNRGPDKWINDLYKELECLGKLSPKDVVELSEKVFRLAWEDFELPDLDPSSRWYKKYEDLEEDEQEVLEENCSDAFGMGRDELLNIDQLNIDQFTEFVRLSNSNCDDLEAELCFQRAIIQNLGTLRSELFPSTSSNSEQTQDLAADLQRVREEYARVGPPA